METKRFKINVWYIYKRVHNLDFSEIATIIVALLLAISVALPQLEKVKNSQQIVSVDFKSETGEVIKGDITIHQGTGNILNIISLITAILGPLILLWKFLQVSKNREILHKELFEQLVCNYTDLLKFEQFKNSKEKQIINDKIASIKTRGEVKPSELKELKELMTPYNKSFK